LFSLALGEALTRVFGLIAAIVVARALGPSSLGALAFAQSLVIVASAVSDGGLTLHGTARLVHQPQLTARVTGAILWVQVVLALGLIVILVVLALLLPLPRLSELLLLVLLPYLLLQAANLQYVLQAQERMATASTLRAFGQFVTAVLSIAGALLFDSVVAVAIAFWVGLAITDVLTMFQLKRSATRVGRPTRREMAESISGGLPYLSASLTGQYILALPTVTLAILASEKSAGEYSAAFRIAFLVQFVISLVTAAVYPEMLRRFSRSPESFALFLRQLLTVALRLGLGLAALIAVVSPDIIRLLYGSEFKKSGAVLTALAFAIPLGYVNALLSRALMVADRQRVLAKQVVLSAGFASCLLPLAARFGGAAVVGAGAVLILLAQTLLLARVLKFLDVRPVRTSVLQGGFFVVPFLLMLATRQLGYASLWLLVFIWAVTLAGMDALLGQKLLRVVMQGRMRT
jgi:O-antigen/teichoic acid export membrane protein